MGTNDLILITFGCTGFLIMIVGFILEKIIEHNHRESEKVIKKYIDECVKANAGTGDRQLTIPDVSKAKRTFCDGCMMPDGQNLGNMYICPKCGRSVD